MKVCIYGAGAIGGCLAVGLAEVGLKVSLVVRGPHLLAIRERGLTLRGPDGERTVRLAASENPEDLGAQDAVVVALKAHAVPAEARRMTALFHDGTAVVTAVNGVPWWYFHGIGGPLEGTRLESVDPGGVQWDTIGPERVIGCVAYPAAEFGEPGVVRLIAGDRLALGEPSGQTTDRVTGLSEAFRAGGFKAPVEPRIRDEIWAQLWGDLSLGSVSALTTATLEEICRFPETRAVVRSMMQEGQAIGEALGVGFAVDVEERIARAEALGAHETPMLQDLERRRPMEIDALVSAVQELGRLTEVPTPTIDAVLGLLKLRGFKAGGYGLDF